MFQKILFVALLAVAMPIRAQLTVTAQDVGEMYQLQSATTSIEIANRGDKPIALRGIVARDPADSVGAVPPRIAAHATVHVPVTIFNGMGVGKQQHVFVVETDSAAARPDLQARVHLFGLSVLDDDKPQLDLGTVESDKPSAPRTVALSSREVAGFRIERILAVPAFVSATLRADGTSIAIAAKPDAAWGLHQGYVKVALNSSVQSQAWIAVKADVHGEIYPLHNPLDLGVVGSARPPAIVQLRSRNGTPVKLGKIASEGFQAQLETQVCSNGIAGCAQIAVRFDDAQSVGPVRGSLLVDLPDYARQLRIAVNGAYQPQAGGVRTSSEITQPPVAKSSAQTVDSALKVLAHNPAPVPPADPPGTGPLLRWQASNEGVVYGYLIYRSASEQGPFLRVNKDIVASRAQRNSSASSAYVWRDTSAVPGKTYWYYIGLIYGDGSKQQLSGPQKVTAR